VKRRKEWSGGRWGLREGGNRETSQDSSYELEWLKRRGKETEAEGLFRSKKKITLGVSLKKKK